MRSIANKKIAAVALGAVALTGTGVAYAYWTTSGDGTGTATNATSNGTLKLAGSWAAGLYPGGERTVSFTAENLKETTLQLGTIHLDRVSVDALHSGCAVGDFTMEDVVSDQSIETTAAGEPEKVTATGTLKFANDSAKSQDACKGAQITLHLSAAPTAPASTTVAS